MTRYAKDSTYAMNHDGPKPTVFLVVGNGDDVILCRVQSKPLESIGPCVRRSDAHDPFPKLPVGRDERVGADSGNAP
jgi:hypothetical protein